MPSNAITIDTSIEIIPYVDPSYYKLCIVGTGVDVDEEYHYAATFVETESEAEEIYGDSQLTDDIKGALRQGIDNVYAIHVETDIHTETQTDVTSVTTGQLEYPVSFALSNGEYIEIADPEGLDLFATYEDVSEIDDPQDYELYINTLTGAYAVGGLEGGDLSMTYHVVDWEALEDELDREDIDVTVVSGAHQNWDISVDNEVDDVYGTSDVFDYGDVGSIVELLPQIEAVTVLPVVSYDRDPKTFTVDVPAYQSSHVIAVTHLYDMDDINGRFGGALVRVDPNDKVMWKRVRGLTNELGRPYTASMISEFEQDYLNAIVIINDQTLFSNGYTTMEEGTDDYRYIDVIRTQYLIERRIRRGLTNLIKDSVIPFNPEGFSKVRAKLVRIMQTLVEEGIVDRIYEDIDGDTRSGYRVIMPPFSQVTSEDKAQRRISNVSIMCKISGHVQAVTMDLTLLL